MIPGNEDSGEPYVGQKENPHTSYGAGFQAGIVNGVQALDAGYFLHSTSR